MAQKILLRRGGIENIGSTIAVTKGELLYATGSVGGVENVIFIANETNNNTFVPVNKLYSGTAAANSFDAKLNGLPYYKTDSKALFILNSAGSTALDLSGNLEGTEISSITASGSFSGSFQGDGSGLTGVPATGIVLSTLSQGDGIESFSYNGQSTQTVTLDTGSLHFISGSRKTISVENTTGASGIDLTYDAGTGVLSGSLVNSSITLGTTEIDLGATETSVAGLTLTGATASGSFSGSFQGNGSALTNISLGSISAPGSDTQVIFNSGGNIAASSKVTISSTAVGLTNLDLSTTGDITGSSLLLTGDADISGNIVLGGNITIGNDDADNISLGGEFTSNLVPNADSTYDLGANGKRWANIYVDNVSGSTAGFSGAIVVGGSITAGLSAGTDNSVVVLNSSNQLVTDEIDSRVWGATLVGTTGTPVDNQLAIFTAADTVEGVAGLTFNGSLLAVDGAISASSYVSASDTVINGWGSVSASLAAIESGTNALSLNDVTTVGGVTANSIQVGGLIVTGDLTVSGTSTTVNSTIVEIGDNIIVLNGSGAANGGLLVKDVDAPDTASGSLLWDSNADYWKGGAEGSEKEFARFNTDPTTNKVAKVDANGLLVDSTITDNGTAVSTTSTFSATTITASTGFVASGLTGVIDTSSRVIYRDGSNRLGALATTDSAVEVSTVMGYKSDGTLVATSVIDGGTF